MAQDYYKTLGVSRTASSEEIQKAYRNLARKYHPDLNPDKAATKKFQEIQAAYDVLGDEEKRKLYDQYGSDFDKVSANPFSGAGGGQQVDFEEMFGKRGGRGGFGFDLGDIFKQFGGQSPRGAQRESRGSDLQTKITVPFATAVLGGEVSINVDRGGKPESIKVRVPAGIEPGKKIRLRGQGEAGPNSQNGDMLIEIDIAAHPLFSRKGKNLECRLPVTIGEAFRGCKIDVPTPTGTLALTIPPLSSSGRRLRVKGKGIASKSNEPGDLIYELEIKSPDEAAGQALLKKNGVTLDEIEAAYTSNIRADLRW